LETRPQQRALLRPDAVVKNDSRHAPARNWPAAARRTLLHRQPDEIMMAFPSRYTADIADTILAELLRGRTLREVCRDDGLPAYGTVQQWVSEDRGGFSARYRRARKLGHATLGRPTRCTADIAERILHELANGRTLTDICGDPGMPSSSTVRQWAMEDRDGFAARYSKARQFGCDAIADQIIDIADDSRHDLTLRRKPDGTTEYVADPGNIRRSQERIKARCWLLSKLLPKICGSRSRTR
jgi:hypothetical protein